MNLTKTINIACRLSGKVLGKLFLLVAVGGIAFCYSCGKEPQPADEPPEEPLKAIAETYWMAESALGDKYELTFTASTAAYIFKGCNGYTWIDECPYTYNPPAITMEVAWRDPPIQLKGSVVDSDDLTIELLESYDALRTVDLKKQDPKGEEEPMEPSIIGEWKLTHHGTIIDGIPDMEPYKGMAKYTLKYTFREDGTGWAYYSNEHQESFKWRWLSDDQLALTNWKPETEILIDPGSHYMEEKWTVRELTSDQLTVSYWMLPTFDENLSPYQAIMTFEKLN